MAVPDYESLMLPLLKFTAESKKPISTQEAVEALSVSLHLSDGDLQELLPSGTQRTIVNRVGWAATYMKKAGLIAATSRGYYEITDLGRDLLKTKPSSINSRYLEQYPKFLEFKRSRGTRRKMVESSENPSTLSSHTPSEALETAYQNLREDLIEDLLTQLKVSSPSFFERVVVDLLVKMGYGGSRVDAGKAIGRSGDGGLDGIIKEDRLGLDVIYIQAKRWDSNPVGRPDLMQFAGALQAQKAPKGVFITTSRFTDDARGYVTQIGSKIVLIDGTLLANLMIEYDVGVTTVSYFPVKKVDLDYFDESS
ncbi:MAG: restriction endonuclease [Caldiserica bacterium]|nr:restriction endonuclease [Caldisericota bacterium]